MSEASPAPEAPEMAQLEIRKGADAELVVGGLRLVACRREVDVIDGGITLYLRADGVGGSETEAVVDLVRMDLFRERPHYHAPAENDAEVEIPASGQGVRAWGVEAITQRAPALAREAGFDEIAAKLDAEALAAAGPAFEALLDGLAEPTEISHFEVPASVIASLKN